MLFSLFLLACVVAAFGCGPAVYVHPNFRPGTCYEVVAIKGGRQFIEIGCKCPDVPPIVEEPTPTPSPEPSNVKITLDDSDPILGNPDAEIVVVEFSDFQCPFCSRAANGAVAELKLSDEFMNGD